MGLNEEVHTIRDLIDRGAEAQPDRVFLMTPRPGMS